MTDLNPYVPPADAGESAPPPSPMQLMFSAFYFDLLQQYGGPEAANRFTDYELKNIEDGKPCKPRADVIVCMKDDKPVSEEDVFNMAIAKYEKTAQMTRRDLFILLGTFLGGIATSALFTAVGLVYINDASNKQEEDVRKKQVRTGGAALHTVEFTALVAAATYTLWDVYKNSKLERPFVDAGHFAASLDKARVAKETTGKEPSL